MNHNEIWRNYNGSIKQFHNLIKVSNMGRVYKKGLNTSKNQSGILKGYKNSLGYIVLHISINGKIYSILVHRLVAETFCPNPQNKPEVDHINAIRDDNRACNLRWVTQAENCHNPIYLKKLSKIAHDRLMKFNYLAHSNFKAVKAINIDGRELTFSSIKELQKYFQTKANITRIIKKGTFVKSSKSKLKGWKITIL